MTGGSQFCLTALCDALAKSASLVRRPAHAAQRPRVSPTHSANPLYSLFRDYMISYSAFPETASPAPSLEPATLGHADNPLKRFETTKDFFGQIWKCLENRHHPSREGLPIAACQNSDEITCPDAA
jgi:hypothetical protein